MTGALFGCFSLHKRSRSRPLVEAIPLPEARRFGDRPGWVVSLVLELRRSIDPWDCHVGLPRNGQGGQWGGIYGSSMESGIGPMSFFMFIPRHDLSGTADQDCRREHGQGG